MVVGEKDRRPHSRRSVKAHASYNNYQNWKDKLRENCFRRVREDRTRLLWRLRLADIEDQSLHNQDIIKSTFRDIVSDELRRIKDSSLNENLGNSNSTQTNDDDIWEYDGLHTAYQGDCEEMLLEMQRIFYEDLAKEECRKESNIFNRIWDDEEDEYLARAVYEHMQLNSCQVTNVVWCPVCKQGELQQNYHLIYCTLCRLKLVRDDEPAIKNTISVIPKGKEMIFTCGGNNPMEEVVKNVSPIIQEAVAFEEDILNLSLNNETELKEIWEGLQLQLAWDEGFCNLKRTSDQELGMFTQLPMVRKLLIQQIRLEINLDLLRNRLAEAHAEHLDRGCRLKPEFSIESRFQLTALYMKCQGCNTFEVVI